jgi:hypothetical protein
MSVSNTMEGTISMKIYTVLKGEHREVRAMFKALKTMPNREVFKKLCDELISHANAVQETVYSQAAERIGAGDITKAEHEHEEVQQIITSLKAMNIDSEEWKNQLKILNDKVEAHVKFEEGEVFPKMMEKFNDAEAKTIAKQFHEVKNRELETLSNEK